MNIAKFLRMYRHMPLSLLLQLQLQLFNKIDFLATTYTVFVTRSVKTGLYSNQSFNFGIS